MKTFYEREEAGNDDNVIYDDSLYRIEAIFTDDNSNGVLEISSMLYEKNRSEYSECAESRRRSGIHEHSAHNNAGNRSESMEPYRNRYIRRHHDHRISHHDMQDSKIDALSFHLRGTPTYFCFHMQAPNRKSIGD